MISSTEDEIVRPENVAQLSEVIQTAAASRRTLKLSRRSHSVASVDVGAKTSPQLLDLSAISGVVDYPARDMTITVQAGLPVLKLQEILATENQQLPIDCCDEAMTVGALVASDVSGPRQFGYGTLRDYVIGIEAVDGQGRIFHAGGRVVKNVAGYDLCRLMVGSRGALGVISQVTFKVKPRPEARRLISFRFDSDTAFETALVRLNLTAATPTILDFATEGSVRWLHLGVEGSEAVCEWQLNQLTDECCSSGHAAETEVNDVEYCCRFMQQISGDGSVETSSDRQTNQNLSVIPLRLVVPPSNLTTVTEILQRRSVNSFGHAGHGIVYVPFSNRQNESPMADEDRSELIAFCRRLALERNGHVTEWQADHPAARTDSVTRRLCDTFDPSSVFQR